MKRQKNVFLAEVEIHLAFEEDRKEQKKMIVAKKSYEAPSVQLIQFEGNDAIATSGEMWFNCTTGWRGNYALDDEDHCSSWIVTDNSIEAP